MGFCQKKGGDLASLHSVVDVDTVYALAGGDDSWIGLKRDTLQSKWGWVDHSFFGTDKLSDAGDTKLWQIGHGHDNVCARWGWKGQKKWDDVSCKEIKPFTCMNSLNVFHAPFPPPPPAMFSFHDVPKSFAKASAYCLHMGGS